MRFFLVAQLPTGGYKPDLHWREGVVDRPTVNDLYIYIFKLRSLFGLAWAVICSWSKKISHMFFPQLSSKTKTLEILSQTISSFPPFFPTLSSFHDPKTSHLKWLKCQGAVWKMVSWSPSLHGMLWNTSQEKCIGYISSMKFYQNGSVLTKVTKAKKLANNSWTSQVFKICPLRHHHTWDFWTNEFVGCFCWGKLVDRWTFCLEANPPNPPKKTRYFCSFPMSTVVFFSEESHDRPPCSFLFVFWFGYQVNQSVYVFQDCLCIDCADVIVSIVCKHLVYSLLNVTLLKWKC